MVERLPPALQQIFDVDLARSTERYGPVRHGIEFVTEGGTTVAEFVSEGYLNAPAVGQRIRIHGVRVIVLSVDVSYEATEDGAPAVSASVVVGAEADE
ncbi:hypothetical protein [Streptomyces sp. NPDC050738]|uniref:hypothetical protein n=1 Tax=Streptomyces sp. NPDC050738 TaxID=3154744 RepID=UPI00341DE3D2